MPFTPYDAARHMMSRAEALIDLASLLSQKNIRATTGRRGRLSIRNDLRRLAIVMAVGALDTYMHRLIVTRAYTQTPMPPSLATVTIRFGDLIGQADAAVSAHREGRSTRPRVPAKRLLRERLLRETYQRYDRVGDAMAMAGKPQSWEDIVAAMPGAPTKESVKDSLNRIVERRNAIVHEGDYERLDRPQYAKMKRVTVTESREAVRFLGDLIDAIHVVASK